MVSHLGRFIYSGRRIECVERTHRAFALKAPIVLLVFIVIMPLVANTGIDVVIGADTPEPVGTGSTSRFAVSIDDADDGFTLIAPYSGTKVYLVTCDGVIIHTWSSTRATTGNVKLLPDGTLLRGRSGVNGLGDGVHILDWDGTVLWDYTPPSPYTRHHDIEAMPNGNVLMNTMVQYKDTQMIAMGRDPNNTPAQLPVEPIIEVKPNGPNGGKIVWSWNPLDHTIQDFNPDKSNYGVVKDHPELIDINFPAEFTNEWQHSNGVAYNADLDQVMITNRNFDEFWVVDHNTTIGEAKNHTGGAHGKGGDLLYRWGNPRAYGSGDKDDQTLWGPHDAHWIAPGLPGAGHIIVFNNGMNMYMTRPDGAYSSIEELVPPLNVSGEYELGLGSVYGPASSLWSYNASPPEDFFTWAMGGVERLPDGNTLICGGSTGYNFEVTPLGEVVWSYRSNGAFKVSRYYPPYMEKVPDLQAMEDVPLRVDISQFLSDLDTDVEDLVIDESSPYATVSGHELQLLYPEGITSDVINVTIADGIFEVGRKVRVNITRVNDPPILAPIPEITATEDVPYLFFLRPYVTDPDNTFSELAITMDSPYVTLVDGDLRFLYPEGVLSDVILLRVSDGELEDQGEITVSVTPVNDLPTVDPVPDQVGFEDVPWTLDLARFIHDVDDPLEGISVVSDSPYARVSGLRITFLYPEAVTRDVVHFAVSDGKGSLVVTIGVIVEPVNDPPAIADLPPVTVTEDEPFALDLETALSDIDTPLDGLTIQVESPFIEVKGHTLNLLYPDGVLRDEVVVEVSDGYLKASTSLTINVEPVNDAPEIGDIAFVMAIEDEPFYIDLGPLISDIDTPMDGISVEVDSPYISVEGHVLVLLYPEGVREEGVIVSVSDGELSDSSILVVNVQPVNDPPWWADLPEIMVIEDEDGEMDLTLFMNDVDTAPEDLVVEVVSSYGTMEGHFFTYLYPDGVLSEQVTFTLWDGEFKAVLRTVVTVYPVNDAPELLEAAVDPAEGEAGTPLRFTVMFRDVDMGSGDPVVWVVIDGRAHECTRVGLDTSPYSEGVSFVLEVQLASGTHTFHFEADDGDGGSTSTEPRELTVRASRSGGGESLPITITAIALILSIAALVGLLSVWKRQRSG